MFFFGFIYTQPGEATQSSKPDTTRRIKSILVFLVLFYFVLGLVPFLVLDCYSRTTRNWCRRLCFKRSGPLHHRNQGRKICICERRRRLGIAFRFSILSASIIVFVVVIVTTIVVTIVTSEMFLVVLVTLVARVMFRHLIVSALIVVVTIVVEVLLVVLAAMFNV